MPYLIDTDGGVDDALALLYALGSPGVDLVAITVVFGNTTLEFAFNNVMAVLDIVERSRGNPFEKRPRVAMGASIPMVRPFTPVTSIHGVDGLGNLDQYKNVDGTARYARRQVLPDSALAADVILESADRYGSQLSIVAIGPLTNIAHACHRDAQLLRGVKQIVVMGGAVTVPGNVMPLAEFNIHCDPEAAAIVFDSGLPITLVPLDATHQAILTSEVLSREVQAHPSIQSQFVWDCTRLYSDFYCKADQMDGFPLHDPLAFAIALDRTLTTFARWHVRVETHGEFTLGQIVADRRERRDDLRFPPNMQVATKIRMAQFMKMFKHRVLCPATAHSS